MASGLVRPAGALALLGAPAPTLRERLLGRVPATGATIELRRPADLVGLVWQRPAGTDVWLRFRALGGRWSEWVPAGARGHGPEAPPADNRQVGEPVWTGGATALQIRPAQALAGVRLQLVDVSGGVGAGRLARLAGAMALAAPLLAAGPGQPPIIARRAWAAGISPPRVAPEYGAVRLAFVHHTENPNGYLAAEVPAMLRAIYIFHRYANGWNDIGYNFVIDSYGRIFEARAGGIDEPVVGAQAGGYNIVSTGVAVLGSFMAVPISSAARSALQALLAWKLSLHGVPAAGRVTVRVNPAGASYSRFPANARVSLPHIAGHRDGDATECPGDALYAELPAIRAAVGRLAGEPARATLAPGPQQTLEGRLGLLDGSPLAGAPILLQARSVKRKGEVVEELTVAETSTNAEGQWSLPASALATLRGAASLRVLCPGGGGFGACVSEPLNVPAAPLPPAPAGPAG